MRWRSTLSTGCRPESISALLAAVWPLASAKTHAHSSGAMLPNVRCTGQGRYGGGGSAAASYEAPLQVNFWR